MKTNIIEYILKNTDYIQRDIADKLGVSRAQVSKWKHGSYIPFDRLESLKEMASLTMDNVDWEIFTATQKNSDQWVEFVSELNDSCLEGRPDPSIQDEPDVYVPSLVLTLKELGLPVPQNPYGQENAPAEKALIEKFFPVFMNEYNKVSEWMGRFLRFNDCDLMDQVYNLESYIPHIVIFHLDGEEFEGTAINARAIKDVAYREIGTAKRLIGQLCKDVLASGEALTVEPFDLIQNTPNELQDAADFFSIAPSVKDFLPIGQQQLLRQLETNQVLLEELHTKLDFLLSEEDRALLSDTLELTKPNLNLDLMKMQSPETN